MDDCENRSSYKHHNSNGDCAETMEMLNTSGSPGYGDDRSQIPNAAAGVDEAEAGRSNGGNVEGKRKRKENMKRWNQKWHEFCDTTTLHGLRQIAEPQPYMLRRLIWVLLVLVGSSLFLYQMITGIMYFYTYPVSVNVKINYNDTLQFPAFTICNQNAFRKTVAAEKGWYHILSEIFSHTGHHHDVEVYNDTDLTVYELFDTTGHALHDLIVRCMWDGEPCYHHEFVTTMTDYGKCYTFNSDTPHYAKRTGTEGGLQLLLNVEQYEYMPGPNQGAGLRMLLHHPREVPLVRDFGIAAPPGSYSLLGTTLIRIENLPEPHGQCDDTQTLKYYDTYSKQNCLENCKQIFVEERCGCRHINMVDDQDGISHCTVAKFQTCIEHALEDFNKEGRPECRCPIPCRVDSLELFNSIGDISAFDALNLLNSDLTDKLEPKYRKAQEVSQRVTKKIIQDDERFVEDLASAVLDVDIALDEVMEGFNYIESYVNDMYEVMEKRLQFHRKKGLGRVKYIMEHDFVRGWTILEERTLPYLTFDFFELRGSFRRAIELLAASQNGTDDEQFLARSRWVNFENSLQERLDISVRVTDNITEVHEKYKNGKPLLTFRASRHRRYDMSWITVDLLQANVNDDGNNQDKIYSELFRRLNQFITAVNTYKEMGNNFTETFEIDEALWKKTDKLFRDGSVFYNYNVFLYKTRIVDGPVITINKRIEEFDILNRTLATMKHKLSLGITSLKYSISLSRNTTWKSVRHAMDDARLYLKDHRQFKTDLAEHLTSPDMVKAVRDLDLFFSDLRSSGRLIHEKMLEMKIALEDVWMNILTEYSTENFYAKVHEDFSDYPNRPGYYLPYFADLLDVSLSKLENVSAAELEYRLNADFNVTNATNKFSEIEESFRHLENYTNIARILGVADETFSSVITAYMDSLTAFLAATKIDTDFYLANFIQLSVFMQELSYEEILQQPAYDMLNLLGDIGGSVGLFLGASALTLAEITDVIIMHIMSAVTMR